MPHEILFSLLDETQNTKNGKKKKLKKKKKRKIGCVVLLFQRFYNILIYSCLAP